MSTRATLFLALFLVPGPMAFGGDGPCAQCPRCSELRDGGDGCGQKAVTDLLSEIELEIKGVGCSSKTGCPECDAACDDKPRAEREGLGARIELRVLVTEVARCARLEPSECWEAIEARELSEREVEDYHRQISSMVSEGHAKILARPILSTLAGRTARLEISEEVPVRVPDNDDCIVEFFNHGIRLECVPHLVGQDRIAVEMDLELTCMDFDHGTTKDGCRLPVVLQRRLETTLELAKGGTVLLAAPSRETGGALSRTGCGTDACRLATAAANCLTVSSIWAGPVVVPCADNTKLKQCATPEKQLIVTVSAILAGTERADLELPAGALDRLNACHERDTDGPHRSAILLTPGDIELASPPRAPQARLSLVVPDSRHSDVLLRMAPGFAVRGLTGNILPDGKLVVCQGCKECQQKGGGACEECEDCIIELEAPSCGHCGQVAELRARSQGDEVECFVEQVLHAQAQYLETIMRAQLDHERVLLQVKAEAESALAKQKLAHAQETMRLNAEHREELHAMREAMWTAECKRLEARHEQALEHEREWAAMRHKKSCELHSQQISALEAEVRWLRGRIGSDEPERVAQSKDGNRQSNLKRRPAPLEVPIQVEQLASGRVRYSPAPPSSSEVIVLSKPTETVEHIEYSMPPLSTSQRDSQEMERLRREVARLRLLVEDMLCTTPDMTPMPVPHAEPD